MYGYVAIFCYDLKHFDMNLKNGKMCYFLNYKNGIY